MDDERLFELEARAARAEDLLDELNRTVYAQQKQLDALEKLCTELARRLKEVAASGGSIAPLNEKPPHY